MNLKQLKAFRAVMVTGSVSEAARSLFRTQPTVSALIAGLEAEIGYPLFERRSRRLHPVPEAFSCSRRPRPSSTGWNRRSGR